MFAIERRAVQRYATVGIETGVEAADPHQLVLMLFDGTMLALADGKGQMSRGEIGAKGASLSKAIAIIENGLKASLDIAAGGELGEKLAALYDYMAARLVAANLHNRPELIDEVSRLLAELREAWRQIRPVNTASHSPPTAAPRAAPSLRKA